LGWLYSNLFKKAGQNMSKKTDDAIAAAWAKHSQRPKTSIPAGCGGFALLQGPALMAELGFREAAREVLQEVTGVAGDLPNTTIQRPSGPLE